MQTQPLSPKTSMTAAVNGEAVIDLDAVAHNVRVLCDHAGPAQVMAVVKSDGYGHGAIEVARAALGAGAAELKWPQSRRRWHCDRRASPHRYWPGCIPQGTDFERLCRPASRSGVICPPGRGSARRGGADRPHRCRDGQSGNRTQPQGRSPDYPELLDALGRAAAADSIRPRGIMSHLASGDEPDNPLNDLQARRFTEMIAAAHRAGIDFEVAHLSNSPSAMTRPTWPSTWCGPVSPSTG